MKKLIVMLVGFILALQPVAAQAHGFNIYHGNDKAHVGTDHNNVWVYDRECDGNSVRVEARYPNFSSVMKDENGCTSGGDRLALGANANAVRICEFDYYWRCTSWRSIT